MVIEKPRKIEVIVFNVQEKKNLLISNHRTRKKKFPSYFRVQENWDADWTWTGIHAMWALRKINFIDTN